jgi:glyoxylase-like metal-dependent hydrolase (beta-lactamase superfamily II)
MDRPLTDGVTVTTDVGEWRSVETPGHAPSHVCLWQRERRLLLSGDHLLGRISLYFDHGYTPDPVGEFLASLDRVEQLGVRLCLAGHGRTFTDVKAHIEGNRKLVRERLEQVRTALDEGATTPEEVARRVYGEAFAEGTASWLATKTRCYLTHLERTGAA